MIAALPMPIVALSTAMSENTSIAQGQDRIYKYFFHLVNHQDSTIVLGEFHNLFICCRDTANAEVLSIFYSILLSNQETSFYNTLKRCCYILVNHWELTRQYGQIQALVQLFGDELVYKFTTSPTLRQLRTWLKRFIQSQDYQDLCLFAFRHGVVSQETSIEPSQDEDWVDRYHIYRLVQQATDTGNPLEQRRAAQIAAVRLKHQFKVDLAMYTVRCQLPHVAATEEAKSRLQNPTQLGDEVLWLVKMIVAQQGTFRYHALAQLFLRQMEGVDYGTFKAGLLRYLTYSAGVQSFTRVVQTKLLAKLEAFQSDRDDEVLSGHLLKSTCNHMIDCLTTDNGESPAALFHLFQVQGLPLTLVMMLLKLVLVSLESRTHMESRLAELIQHYSVLPIETCQNFITFLEVLRVAFTICCEDVEYDLVEMQQQAGQAGVASLDDYRLFSHRRQQQHSKAGQRAKHRYRGKED